MYASIGVSGDGFMMTVHPVSSAGAILLVITSSGAFHGVIAATTPTGSRTSSAMPLPYDGLRCSSQG